MSKKEKNNRDKVSSKELRYTFYKCRDFELSHLWQRSIFLSAFIVLLFTGYGFIVIKILDSTRDITSLYLHLIACSIAFVGSIFSVLWITMAKGSKYWYEIYESLISDIERELDIPKNFRMGYSQKKVNDNIFSTDGGRFSVSRINVLIGQLIFVLWSFILFIHICLLMRTLLIKRQILEYDNDSTFIAFLVALIVTFFFANGIFSFIKNMAKSKD